MDPGVLILGGAFGGAAALVGGHLRRRRRCAARLEALGFSPHAEGAHELRRLFTELAGGYGEARRRTWRVTEPQVRHSNAHRVHHFTATDLDAADREEGGFGGSLDVWLLERPDIAIAPAVSIVLAPPGPRLLRAWLRRRVLDDPWGAVLTLPGAEDSAAFLAAFGKRPGALADVLPEAARPRLLRAGRHGFVAAHLGGGRAAFAAAPGRRDVAEQWRWVADWLPAPPAQEPD